MITLVIGWVDVAQVVVVVPTPVVVAQFYDSLFIVVVVAQFYDSLVSGELADGR